MPTIILSKSARKFQNLVDKAPVQTGRFNPRRSEVAEKKPTIAEKAVQK